MSSNVFDGAEKVFDTRCHWERPGAASAAGWRSTSLMIKPLSAITGYGSDCNLEGAVRHNQNLIAVEDPAACGCFRAQKSPACAGLFCLP